MAGRHRGREYVLKAVSLAALILCAAACLLAGRSLSSQRLADWIPRDPLPAALLVVLLYAAKSLTVFFPLLTLYLLSGILFPAPLGVLVNVLGLAVWGTVPYLIGRRFGPGYLTELRQRRPKLELLEVLRRKSGFQFALLTRAVGVLPGDIVSLYFGCAGLSYPAYLAGSVLGLAPGMIAATVLGGQITDPGSPGFLISAGCGLVLTAASFLACRRVIKQERDPA